MNKPVLIISLPGYDADDAAPENCAIHSNYAVPKINKRALPVHRGLITLNFLNHVFAANVDEVLYQFPHGYDYVPMVWGVVKRTDSGATPGIFGFMPFVTGTFGVSLRADSKYVYLVGNFGFGGNVGTISLDISYAIFGENGAGNK